MLRTRHSAHFVPRAAHAAGAIAGGLCAVVALTGFLAAIDTRASAAGGGSASTDPSGAHVEVHWDGSWHETGSGGGAHDGGSTSSGCARRWVPLGAPIVLTPGMLQGNVGHVPRMGPAPSPEHKPYAVYCDDTYLGSEWIAPAQFGGGPAPDVIAALAARLVQDLPYPAAEVGIHPGGRGLTGLESWFWMTGYTGAPLADSVGAFGILVDVEARPAGVSWDFGDGSPPVAGTLGHALPARSDVVHLYEAASRPGTFTVRAALRLEVRYRVDGGPWIGLAPVIRSADRDYPVVESRATLVPGA